MSGEDKFVLSLVALALCAMLAMGVYVAVATDTQRKCLRAGYRCL